MKSGILPLFTSGLIVLSVFKDTNAVFWPCESSVDCTVENSVCSNFGLCECNFGYLFSSDYKECLPISLQGDQCEDSSQCNHMPSGATCKQGKCDCDDGLTYARGKCRQLNGLGENCNENIDCQFGYDPNSVACSNNICSCADGYYKRDESNCRFKAMAINDPCVVDSDCDEIESGAKCDNYKCSAISQTQSREIGVQTSLDNYNLKPISEGDADDNEDANDELSKASENKTGSNISTTNEKETENRLKYGEACANNGKECEGLGHSICAANICYCKMGYYQKNGKCLAELGEIADKAELCEFEYEDNRVCACVKNFFYESNLRGCRKPIAFNLSCTSNSQCSPYSAYCHPTIPRRCRCIDIAEFDEKRQMCVYKQGLGAPCETNTTCILAHTYCSAEKVCSCQENYTPKDGVCIAGIGAECNDNEDCQTENTACENSQLLQNENKSCQCRKGYVHFKDECLQEAEEIGAECSESEQCKPLLASCIDKKCSCKDKEHFSYGKCEDQKGIGEACSRAGECFMPSDPKSVECRNSVCQCQLGYQKDVEKHVCIKVKPRKNSSGRPSCLKIITFVLIGSAFVITTAALKQAYY